MEKDTVIQATGESDYANTVAVFGALLDSKAGENTSVALQQKPESAPDEEEDFLVLTHQVDYFALTNDQLHRETLTARVGLYQRCVEIHSYALEVLVPACQEIIARFKMQGVAAEDRPNRQPTVEAYFRSIDLNYNTVRSWIHRKKLQTEMFVMPKPSRLETKLLNTASAGHALVNAIRHGGNVDEAVKAFKDAAPAPQRDFCEEQIERPLEGALSTLVLQLVGEVESFFNGRSKPSMPKKLRSTVDKLKSELQ